MSKGLLGHANHRGLLALAMVFLAGIGLAFASTTAIAQHSSHDADHAETWPGSPATCPVRRDQCCDRGDVRGRA